jgi:antibiotic biosynthesis monooxygenase (ABM) superfamily enzyme
MSGAPPLRIRLVMALLAWPVAFGLVLTLLTVFKHQLASMPLALRALVLSGALISVMATVVMPLLTVAVSHRLHGPVPKR